MLRKGDLVIVCGVTKLGLKRDNKPDKLYGELMLVSKYPMIHGGGLHLYSRFWYSPENKYVDINYNIHNFELRKIGRL